MSGHRWRLLPLLAVALAGCAQDDGGRSPLGPEYETGEGRVYPVRQVSFRTLDGVTVSGLLGAARETRAAPGVVLVHDLDGQKQTWVTQSPLFVALMERGYAALAVDLRGFGQTLLPGGRQVVTLADLDSSYLDVRAALDWMANRPEVDPARLAVVGSGSGGNIAYVSAGALAGQIRTAVSLSPGLWERTSLRPAVVGASLSPFTPRSILFVVGGEDAISAGDAAGTVLRYADFAASLAARTAEPKEVLVIPGSAAHGLDLLNDEPAALAAVLAWLDERL